MNKKQQHLDIERMLDNIISGSSNEELFRIEQQETPTPQVVPKKPAAVQVQPLAKTEANAQVEAIEFPYEKPKNPVTPVLTENYNRLDQGRKKQQGEMIELGNDAAIEFEQNKNSIGGIMKRMQDLEQKKFEAPEELQAQIKVASNLANSYEYPQQDLLSHAILAFGPALGGAFLGESGQIAQLKAGKEARDMTDKIRKEEIDITKIKNDKSMKRFESLVKLKQTLGDQWTKDLELELKRLDAQLRGSTEVAKLTDGQIKRYDDKAADIGKERAENTTKVAIKTAELEGDPAKAAAALERTKTAGQFRKTEVPSQGERVAAGQLSKLRKANNDLLTIGGADGSSLPSLGDRLFTMKANILTGAAPMSSSMESFVKDPRIRAQVQAEVDWALTVLRDESGAAIGKDEAIKENGRYFPRYGDSQEVIDQKAASRLQKELALEAEAGRAVPPRVVNAQPAGPKPPASIAAPPNGQAPVSGGLTPEQRRQKLIEAVKQKRAQQGGRQ